MTSISIVVGRERVLPVLAVSAVLTWLGDLLFWDHPPGASVALYACIIAATLLSVPAGGRSTRTAWIAGALLLVSSCATLLEISFANVTVLLTLLAVIMGERHFRDLDNRWARWSESLVAWGCAIGRWPWLMRRIGESELANVGINTVTSDRTVRSVQILAPAACLALIFGIVLSFGNAIFGELLVRSVRETTLWFFSFDFSFARTALWIAFATFALALIRPHPAPVSPRIWTRPLPLFTRADVRLAVWQSCAVFIVLNALFFAVNTIDVIYLWRQESRAALPGNVSFSAFVHHGVYSLTFAVMLSAVVIAIVFQQEPTISRHRILKALAGLWIAQNLVLIAGVFLRLKLYVDAYQLSELRVYVGCFLILVTAGFGLLAWHIAQGGNLGTLLWRNALATFALCFVIQFPDITGWVARFNVAQWQRESTRTLDLVYLEALGPGGWPSLIDVASSRNRAFSTALEARERVIRLASSEEIALSERNWRSFQSRRTAAGRELIDAAAHFQIAP